MEKKVTQDFSSQETDTTPDNDVNQLDQPEAATISTGTSASNTASAASGKVTPKSTVVRVSRLRAPSTASSRVPPPPHHHHHHHNTTTTTTSSSSFSTPSIAPPTPTPTPTPIPASTPKPPPLRQTRSLAVLVPTAQPPTAIVTATKTSSRRPSTAAGAAGAPTRLPTTRAAGDFRIIPPPSPAKRTAPVISAISSASASASAAAAAAASGKSWPRPPAAPPPAARKPTRASAARATTGTATATAPAPATKGAPPRITSSCAPVSASTSGRSSPRNPPRSRDGNVTATTRPLPPKPDPSAVEATITTTAHPETTPSPTMPPPLSEKPRPPIVTKPSHTSRPALPLAPKVASAKAGHISAPPAVGRRSGGVPLPRPAVSASSSASASTGVGGDTPPPSGPRDDYIAPTIAAASLFSTGHFISTNVAPRSGARQTRVDQSSPNTPAATPIADKGEWDVRPVASATATVAAGAPFLAPESRKQSGGVESKFFYASEARSPPVITPQGRPTSLTMPKTSSYLHSVGSRRDKAGVQPQDDQGTGNQPDGRQGLRAPASLSSNKPQPGQLGASFLAKRRVSVEATPRVGVHSRSGSVESTVTTTRLASPTPSRRPSGPCTPASPSIAHFQPAMNMASIIQVAEDSADTLGIAETPPLPEIHSPTKSSHSGGGDVNEAVANARRERKVQDLEITNTSLTAINRTLEKQLRKQTIELRRYKRLARSGRLSVEPSGLSTTTSSRMPSLTLSLPAGIGLGLSATGLNVGKPPMGPNLHLDSDASPSEESEDEDELLSLSEEEDEEEAEEAEKTGADPSIRAEREIERRKRDEHRLHLDMSKHHQILVDSQKMNQSLKKCLEWSEQLIREGQKALEYTVKFNDAEIGNRFIGGQPPRRLDEPDQDGNAENDDREGNDAMSETQGTEEWLGEVRSELPKWGEKALHDRDSGVDLPPDGG